MTETAKAIWSLLAIAIAPFILGTLFGGFVVGLIFFA